MEEWKDVVGFEGLYQVSSEGRVVSLEKDQIRESTSWRCADCGCHRLLYHTKEKLLKFSKASRYGHCGVKLYKNGETKMALVHRLVLEAFVGPSPHGKQCRHLDGNPRNNRVDNLRWGTPKENMADRERHGTHDKGSDSVKAKLIELQIPCIRFLLQRHPRRGILSAVARRYRVDVATIRDIHKGFTWGHLPKIRWKEPREKDVVCHHCNANTTHTFFHTERPEDGDYSYRECHECRWFLFRVLETYQPPLKFGGMKRDPGNVAKGTQYSRSGLTEDDVREIRRRKEAGGRTNDIAREFKITAVSVCDIVARRTWKHVV